MYDKASSSYFSRHTVREPRPSRADERAQVERAARGDGAAIHGLFAANLPWIVRIAREFRGRGVPLDDLIAEGCVGILKAIQHYRAVNGTRFMTYASFWIRKEILWAVGEQPNAIHVPIYARRRGHASMRALSLDAPKSNDGDGRLVDCLRHPGALPAETIITRERAVTVRQFLRRLPLREQTIIVRRFGLGGGPQQTLKEIARHLGLTSERVRQIEAMALSRLQRMLVNRAPRAARSKRPVVLAEFRTGSPEEESAIISPPPQRPLRHRCPVVP